jgi:uncharacterized protein (UPF0332 family)
MSLVERFPYLDRNPASGGLDLMPDLPIVLRHQSRSLSGVGLVDSGASNWLDMARDAREAANRLLTEDHYRSAVARVYYAAYSKITHELESIAGLPMPAGREGPSHARIRPVIETSMPNMAQPKRDKLSEMLGRLYALRIDADYRPSVEVEGTEGREAISIMKTIFEAF